MDCPSPKDILAAQNGLLREAEQQELAAHLAQCPRCAALEKTVRELVRLATAVAPTAPLAAPGACPAESDLLNYVAKGLTGTARKQMEAHLSACRQCLWQVAALIRAELGPLPAVSPEWRDAVRQAEALVQDSPKTYGGAWWQVPAWRYALASAAAIVLLALGLVWQGGRTVQAPGPDQAQTPAVEPSPPPAPAPPAPEEPRLLAQQAPPPSQQPETHVRNASAAAHPPLHVLWPQEGKQVAGEELEIRWQTLPGVHLYEVAILNHRGDVVWEGQAQGDRIRVPEDVALQPAERYFVWVTAHVKGDGSVRSPSVAFEIRASSPQ